ncbi:hypothetical protein DIPPA_06712 [Diplonema papillatum]|nr:hypothetical protein DIPPA_06712 [Diplonema papillatum]
MAERRVSKSGEFVLCSPRLKLDPRPAVSDHVVSLGGDLTEPDKRTAPVLGASPFDILCWKGPQPDIPAALFDCYVQRFFARTRSRSPPSDGDEAKSAEPWGAAVRRQSVHYRKVTAAGATRTAAHRAPPDGAPADHPPGAGRAFPLSRPSSTATARSAEGARLRSLCVRTPPDPLLPDEFRAEETAEKSHPGTGGAAIRRTCKSPRSLLLPLGAMSPVHGGAQSLSRHRMSVESREAEQAPPAAPKQTPVVSPRERLVGEKKRGAQKPGVDGVEYMFGVPHPGRAERPLLCAVPLRPVPLKGEMSPPLTPLQPREDIDASERAPGGDSLAAPAHPAPLDHMEPPARPSTARVLPLQFPLRFPRPQSVTLRNSSTVGYCDRVRSCKTGGDAAAGGRPAAAGKRFCRFFNVNDQYKLNSAPSKSVPRVAPARKAPLAVHRLLKTALVDRMRREQSGAVETTAAEEKKAGWYMFGIRTVPVSPSPLPPAATVLSAMHPLA